MATRLYLRNTTQPTSLGYPTTEQSTALHVGTANNTTSTAAYDLSTTKGSAQTSVAWTVLNQTALQSGLRPYRWCTEPLFAQTISANTWTFFFKAQESGGQANMFTAASLYVWRPSTSAVVGYLYDNAAALGAEWSTTAGGSAQSVTFSGSAVTAAEGDIIVFEWWYRMTAVSASAYTGTAYFDGTNETTTGTGNTSCATYIETPQNLAIKSPRTSIVFIM